MKDKILTTCIIIITIISVILFMDYFFYNDQSNCLESGYCKEGLTLKVGKNRAIVINRDTCAEENGEWNEEKKVCQF